ncbi:hypothetical protein COLO4_06805 [Corchorus olitorius]|uniref:BHLH domain-containing protein n=1 Tax=Corchorus olitorius TaxID=93759 RepID=A0A1R3KLV4_9ROSI|nr:hypothetical protein COLO4_06805 [Corchorus olitorius]
MRSKRSPRGRRKVLLTRGRKLRIRQINLSNLPNNNNSVSESLRTSVERKLEELQRILPDACNEINMDTLFQMTADYIFLLEAKVSLLQNLSTFYGV